MGPVSRGFARSMIRRWRWMFAAMWRRYRRQGLPGSGHDIRLGTALAWLNGWPVISNAWRRDLQRRARGVDTAAHRGAVNGKGRTVAAVGTGVEVVLSE